MLKGWRALVKKLWRTPLKKLGKEVLGGTTDAVGLEASPQEIIRVNPPPVPWELYSVYDLRTKFELVGLYHTKVGFPTKSTWFIAIRNNR